MGITFVSFGISRLSYVTELCSPKERQFYIAMLNTITSPFVTFGIAAGAIIGFLGYQFVFLIYILLAGISAAWLIKKVKDPRKIDRLNDCSKINLILEEQNHLRQVS